MIRETDIFFRSPNGKLLRCSTTLKFEMREEQAHEREKERGRKDQFLQLILNSDN